MSEKIVQINEAVIKGQIKKLVRGGVEETLEMYLAGVSVRRVEDITEALWGSEVSPSTISDLNKKMYITLKIGKIVLYKVDGTRMSMWMGSICVL